MLLALLLAGCATHEPFHHTVVIPETIVHLVESRDLVPNRKKGYVRGHEVWVLCDRWEGRVSPDTYVLGHEVQHLLDRVSGGLVLNPDTILKPSLIKISPYGAR